VRCNDHGHFHGPHAGNLQINASISAMVNLGEVPWNGHPPIGTYFNFSDLVCQLAPTYWKLGSTAVNRIHTHIRFWCRRSESH
jgi:hypothetical protein